MMSLLEPNEPSSEAPLEVGGEPLTLEQVIELAQGKRVPVLSAEARKRMQASYDLTQRRLDGGQKIYGVTTGYGNSVSTEVPARDSATQIGRAHV